MDSPQNGGRDSRYNIGYDIPMLNTDNTDLYSGSVLHNRQTSLNSNLSRSSINLSNNSCSSGIQRGLKRSSEMCYDQTRSGMLSDNCSPVMMENSYSPSNQKGSPPSNGKKTKGRVKIKMEYIDNKLRRYTTFSKRKTGIMKKAYELSTLTGTQVMLLVASETGHVYTFATRKLQPMITSEAGKALIQTCLNSPDPCPSGSGDQRMSATGFEETELSYNIADDEKADSVSSSPYHSDSSDSSDVESAPPCSPPPVASSPKTSSQTGIPALVPLQHVQSSPSLIVSSSSNSAPDNNSNSVKTTCSLSKAQKAHYSNGSPNSLICSFDDLERDYGIQAPRIPGGPRFIKIPLPSVTPPAAHQTPADLSNRSRK